MLFHMREMMAKGLKTTVKEDLDVSELFKGRSDVIKAGPLHVSLEVTGHDGYVTAEGELSADLELACSRCLDPTSAHTVIPFYEQFKIGSKEISKDEESDEEDAEDENFVELPGDKLDLKPYLEEALLLFMPFAPLCDKDCKGLCQVCGQNLNEHTCSCNNEKIDHRFAALKDLFKE
ncbi:YceD family protein [Paenibacillus sp. strain BS8-2]